MGVVIDKAWYDHLAGTIDDAGLVALEWRIVITGIYNFVAFDGEGFRIGMKAVAGPDGGVDINVSAGSCLDDVQEIMITGVSSRRRK